MQTQVASFYILMCEAPIHIREFSDLGITGKFLETRIIDIKKFKGRSENPTTMSVSLICVYFL